MALTKWTIADVELLPEPWGDTKSLRNEFTAVIR